MNAIRIRKHLTSDTLRLPELKPLLGKRVEIIVLEEAKEFRSGARKSIALTPPPRSMPKCKSVKDLAAEQGVKLRPIGEMTGGWPADELDDGFEEALREWRREELNTQTQRPHGRKKRKSR